MPNGRNRQICLAHHPTGFPTEDNFALSETAVPEPKEGEMLCRTIYLSLDPYMRGRMNPGPSYAPGVELGHVMGGATVSQVVQSRLPHYDEGDLVLSANGWQEFALSDGEGVRKLDPTIAPISTALGVLGMPGHTAYVGLLDHGRPKAGETVVVSAASGAVGAVVGQLAKLAGCRVIGIAGQQKKCDYVVSELGFDGCVSHHRDDLSEALHAACPDGIDVYFENVGGKVFDAVLPSLNTFARVPVCGRIANYNTAHPPAGPDRVPQLMGLTLVRRITFKGFIIFDHMDRFPAFFDYVSARIHDGTLKYREDLVDGIENTVSAFQGLLRGENFGKLLVRFGDDPTKT